MSSSIGQARGEAVEEYLRRISIIWSSTLPYHNRVTALGIENIKDLYVDLLNRSVRNTSVRLPNGDTILAGDIAK